MVGGLLLFNTQPKGNLVADPAEIIIINFDLPKFRLGHIVATPAALRDIPNDEILAALGRHANGDWGTLDPHDVKVNESALQYGGRLFSQYHSKQKIQFWIITEWDRSVTTVLLPEDY
jgi:hypothetical protein